ncbi:MAG: hypothetical protein EOO16_15400 [Chitinophagaceae bacterium]|nr:MAG: hypothetical protein EOO16_15400 [Chitinophagaceae bacterium]
MNRVAVVFSAVVLLAAPGCKREDPPCEGKAYFFNAELQVEPDQARLAPGDTVYLSGVIPKTLVSTDRNEAVDYSGSTGIRGTVSLQRLDTAGHALRDTGFAVRFVATSGRILDTTDTRNTALAEFSEDAQNYSLRLGLVLRDTGTYLLSITELYSDGLAGQECNRALFAVRLRNPNQRLGLLEQGLGRSFNLPERNRYYGLEVR